MSVHPRARNSLLSRRQSLKSLIGVGLGAGLVLSGCGSGTTFEPLVPTRIVSFGDGWSYVGLTGDRFTVNDSSINIWVEQVASSYSLTLQPNTAGGFSFAKGGARVNTGVDSIQDQITAYLAANTIGTSDLLVIDAGLSELIALATANASDTDLSNAADLAGKALAAQVLSLTAAGAKHVVIANAADLGKTPYATAQARATGLTAATRAFNDGLKIALAGVTTDILLVDNEAYVNTLYNSATALLGSGANITTAACSTPSAQTCTASTLAAGVTSYNLHLFADDRHITPAAHRLLGDNASTKIKARW
jgi:outer membrane lipase/esterase